MQANSINCRMLFFGRCQALRLEQAMGYFTHVLFQTGPALLSATDGTAPSPLTARQRRGPGNISIYLYFYISISEIGNKGVRQYRTKNQGFLFILEELFFNLTFHLPTLITIHLSKQSEKGTEKGKWRNQKLENIFVEKQNNWKMEKQRNLSVKTRHLSKSKTNSHYSSNF